MFELLNQINSDESSDNADHSDDSASVNSTKSVSNADPEGQDPQKNEPVDMDHFDDSTSIWTSHSIAGSESSITPKVDKSLDQNIQNISTAHMINRDPPMVNTNSNTHSLEQPFYDAARYHPPFPCKDPACKSCPSQNTSSLYASVKTYESSPNHDQTLVLEPKTNHDAYSFASKPPMRIQDPYPSSYSSVGDPNRSERSSPQPSTGQNFAHIYKNEIGTKNNLGYQPTALETRPDPEGVPVPPCKFEQKCNWWVRAHDFFNPYKNDLIPYEPTHDGIKEDDMTNKDFYTPFFSFLLGMFYLVIGSSLASPALKLSTFVVFISHLTTLFLYDSESFAYFYQDMYQSLVAYLGQYVEFFFDYLLYIYMLFLGNDFPPEKIHKLYLKHIRRIKMWSYLFKKPLTLLLKTSRGSKRLFKFLLESVYLAGIFYPKVPKSVHPKRLHHINFKGLHQIRTQSLFPNPRNKGIRVHFSNGLPFIHAQINNEPVKFLIDTGSAYNVINQEIVEKLQISEELPKFKHDIHLYGHSGQPLSIDEYAVKLSPKFFDGHNLLDPKASDLHFLVEKNPGAVNILGMNSLRNLEFSSSRGFNSLFLTLKENRNPIGKPVEGSSYVGVASRSCDQDSVPFLDVRFPDLNSYTGCVLITKTKSSENKIKNSDSTLSGYQMHLDCGVFHKRIDGFERGFDFIGITNMWATAVPCSHCSPEESAALAGQTGIQNQPPNFSIEQVEELNENLKVYNAVFEQQVFNDYDLSKDPNDNPENSEQHDMQINSIFDEHITVPGISAESSDSENILEVQVQDTNGNCLLCLENTCECLKAPNQICEYCSECKCTKNDIKNEVNKRLTRTSVRIFICKNILTLSVPKLSEIPDQLPHLSNLICKYVKSRNYDEVRLGRLLGSAYGVDIFSQLSRSLDLAQKGFLKQNEIPITLIPTAKDTVIHALEFDVGKGKLVHRPLLMNDTIGVEDDLTQPPEIKYVLTEKDDLQEVIKVSNPVLNEFLEKTFTKYSDCYVHNPKDYGALKLKTFQLDLEIKDNCEHLLPRHQPFSTNAHITKVCDKITSFWESINLAKPSEITSHASRLLVVMKKVSQRAFENIKKDVEERTSYRFQTNSPNELYSIDPDFLKIKQVNQIFRICLDSRDLNRITKDIVQRSQNPEHTIYNLMMSLGGADKSPTKKYTWKELQDSDPFKSSFPQDPDPECYDIEQITKSLIDTDNRKYWYSTLDISSAHTSVPLTDRAKKLLNFITPSMKIMQFQRAVFGLKNISSQFNGSLCRIISDLIMLGLVHVYADDLIIINTDKETHLALIAEIARRFNNHGLKMSLGKSSFGVEKFEYLGFTFDQDGITLSADRINSLINFPSPIDIKGVQRFLGALNYIQRFIPHYSFNMFPITLLLSEKEFYWGTAQEEAFQRIKNVISDNLHLHYVPPKTQLHLFVDSSLVAGGGVLFCGEPGTPSYKPILYMSKKYSSQEIRRHSALEAEMINLIYCLEKCEYFFTAVDRPVQVHTDAKTVMYLIFGARKTSNPKLARLALKISQYLVNYSINYTSPNCPEMKIADCLSRQYYHLIPKLPGDLIKVIDKKDIRVPAPGIYSFEQLDDWVDRNSVINEENYQEKLIRVKNFSREQTHHLADDNPDNPEHFSLLHIIDWNRLGEFQKKDPKVQEIFRSFSPQEILDSVPKNGFFFNENILYVEKKADNEFPKIYVPDSILTTVVAGAHIAYNHVGAYKHYELLSTLIYNPHLKKVVHDLISKCHLCAIVNCDTNRKGIIDKVRFPAYPGHQVSIDFMTVNKEYKCNSILVIVDLFSNYCVLEPCQNQTSDEAIKALERAFRYIGYPKEIRADGQKSLLKSKAMKKFLKKHRVNSYVYPPYYKYHNASAERQIRNVRQIHRVQNTLDSNFKWYKNLTNTMTVLNAIPRKFRYKGVTRFLSPFEIYFGRRRQIIKIDNYDKFPLDGAKPGSLMASSLRNFTKGAMMALKAEYALKHNDRARTDVIKPGDFYVVQNHKTPAAGQIPLKYRGKFLDNLYLCKKVKGKNVIGVDIILGTANYCSVDHVKIYKEREEYFSELPEYMKKHFGSSLDLKLSLEARKNILLKLQKLGMYENIIRPAETLTSPIAPSSTESGTQRLEMISTKTDSVSDPFNLVLRRDESPSGGLGGPVQVGIGQAPVTHQGRNHVPNPRNIPLPNSPVQRNPPNPFSPNAGPLKVTVPKRAPVIATYQENQRKEAKKLRRQQARQEIVEKRRALYDTASEDEDLPPRNRKQTKFYKAGDVKHILKS